MVNQTEIRPQKSDLQAKRTAAPYGTHLAFNFQLKNKINPCRSHYKISYLESVQQEKSQEDSLFSVYYHQIIMMTIWNRTYRTAKALYIHVDGTHG